MLNSIQHINSDTRESDMDLVREIQNGSRKALESLVKRYQDWIYNISLKMVVNPDQAEDITQEILIKMITKLSTFKQNRKFYWKRQNAGACSQCYYA